MIRPRASALYLVINRSPPDVTSDPGFFTAVDPDLALNPSLGPDVILALGGKQAIHINLFVITVVSPAIRKTEIMNFEDEWMEPEKIALCAVTQSLEGKGSMFSLVELLASDLQIRVYNL